MANYTIHVPGSGDLTMQIGDELTIQFKQHCKFCVTSGKSSDFTPELPSGGVYDDGSSWTGTANTQTTIEFGHVKHDGTCPTGKIIEASGRTITVGGT